jgi:hypothetical protein
MNGAQYEVNVTYYPAALEAIKGGEETRQLVQGRTDNAAFALRSSAPVRSGRGRASITATTQRDFLDGWVGKATWDDEHYYMGIQNSRTAWASKVADRIRYV